MKAYLSKLVVFCIGFVIFSVPSVFAQYTGFGQKVAVIDSGLMSDSSISRLRIDDQLCFSRADRKSSDSVAFSINDNSRYTGSGYFDYEIASTCSNGVESNFSSSTAATVPRKTWHWDQQYNWHYFASPHGTNVARGVLGFAYNAKIIAVNTSFYSADAKVVIGSPPAVECGFHGPDASVSNNLRPSRLDQCYARRPWQTNSSLISKIRSRGNVAAINYSAETLESCSRDSTVFKNLKNAGIAVISGSGNRGIGSRVGFPACSPHVISVGSANVPGGSVHPFTSTDGNIDFFASGFIQDYDTREDLFGTSYAAPRVAGAFAVVKQAKPSATVDEIKQALTKAAFDANKTITLNGKKIPYITPQVTQAAATCIATNGCLPVLPPGGEEVDYLDSGSYGPLYDDDRESYSFDVDFNSLNVASAPLASKADSQNSPVSSNASINVSSRRDIILKFTGVMRDAGSRRFRVKINGISRATFSNYYSPGEQRTFTLYIHRNHLRTGNNIITIEPTTTSYVWGVKDISAEFTPVVPLTIGQKDTKSYGYDHSPKRLTGLRTSFELDQVTNDLSLSVTGWDIDRSDETAVYLNGKRIGFLKTGPSSQNNAGDRFTLRRADLVAGLNMIEYVQRFPGSDWSGYEDEKWAVKNMQITVLKPELSVSSIGIIDRKLEANSPFSVETVVRNTGAGVSSSTTLQYYVSNDSHISTADTRIGTANLAAVAANRTRTVIKSLTSSQVNKNKYFGVCVVPVPNEVNRGNNCSIAIPFRSKPDISPIISILLLGD